MYLCDYCFSYPDRYVAILLEAKIWYAIFNPTDLELPADVINIGGVEVPGQVC